MAVSSVVQASSLALMKRCVLRSVLHLHIQGDSGMD